VEGNLIGPQGGSIWLNMVPKGIYDALSWVSRRYGSPKIYITENGCDILGESEMSFPDVLNDTFRWWFTFSSLLLLWFRIIELNITNLIYVKCSELSPPG